MQARSLIRLPVQECEGLGVSAPHVVPKAECGRVAQHEGADSGETTIVGDALADDALYPPVAKIHDQGYTAAEREIALLAAKVVGRKFALIGEPLNLLVEKSAARLDHLDQQLRKDIAVGTLPPRDAHA